ncbi:MAG TPA: hypothetical protein GXZ48_01810 [Acholeplasmataceae bacterium]|nr:hypothetical protein [Acholeplasmataceae bacterium]
MTKNKSIDRWFIWGIVFICLLGTLLHFTFDLFNHSTFIGLFSPVNESVWEHLKIIFYPTIIWFFILYFKLESDFRRIIISSTISISVSCFILLSIYYIYTGSTGKESVIVDIVAYLLGTTLGQYLALSAYLKLETKNIYFYVSLLFLFAFLISLIYFTFNPPHIPLFFDKSSNQYGLISRK